MFCIEAQLPGRQPLGQDTSLRLPTSPLGVNHHGSVVGRAAVASYQWALSASSGRLRCDLIPLAGAMDRPRQHNIEHLPTVALVPVRGYHVLCSILRTL